MFFFNFYKIVGFLAITFFLQGQSGPSLYYFVAHSCSIFNNKDYFYIFILIRIIALRPQVSGPQVSANR